MKVKYALPCLVIFCLLVGCETIRSAREAQERIKPVAEGREFAAVEIPQLKGATLFDLVSFALTNRPSMRSAELAVKDARLALKEIAADAPIVSSTPWNAASISASAGLGDSSQPAHLSKLKNADDPKGNAGLSLDLLIWDFGRNDARSHAQLEQVLAAETSLLKEGYLVFEEVTSTSFALARAEALRAVAETNLVAYADRLKQAEDRRALGEAMALDVTRARLDLATANETLVAASNEVVTAGANLLSALGLDASRMTVEDVCGKRACDLEALEPALQDTHRSAAEIFAVGREQSPSVVIARARLRAASAQLDYAVADLKPTIKASLGFHWTDPLWYWNWGLSGAQTLFVGNRKLTAVDRAVVTMDSSAVTVKLEELALAQAIEQAVAERDSAREALVAAATRVQRATENLELVRQQVAVGEASRIDFTDAQADYADALGGHIRAFYRGQIAESTLYRLAGEKPVFVSEQ